MAYENNDKKMESVYSIRVKAGKRRTYFFDVRETKGNDFYVTITESRKRFDSDGYDRHKIFLYKEDFNKFLRGLNETVEHVKTELMPDFDFDAFNHDIPYEGGEEGGAKPENREGESSSYGNPDLPVESERAPVTMAADKAGDSIPETTTGDNGHSEEVDKW